MTWRLRRAIVAVLTAGAVLAGTAGRAEAETSWVFRDDMETSAGSWYREVVRYGPCPAYASCSPAYISSGSRYPHSGTHYAWIAETDGPGTWVAFGRFVRLPAATTWCHLSMWIKVVDFANPTVISLDVIEAADWTYETTRTVQLISPDNATYQQIYSDYWYPGARDVYVRVVLPGQSGVPIITADDLFITCRVTT